MGGTYLSRTPQTWKLGKKRFEAFSFYTISQIPGAERQPVRLGLRGFDVASPADSA